MLKALELVGFKSFADKTRLEFPPGITVVVGPNGSGKSNIVDAIKWVLGEQSVKSLRGKEMADVIFNGSSSRRPLNSAETTLTFDNSRQLLAVDSPEVHITRRVYRSGEGEYLINRQPCRLRDIRELFAGTGAATEAYSVIEQGKVDVLLQSSPRERRLIFEEAAGISRFKTKKLEALRRLERVQQNLLRLSDIVDEVENRLKTVRLQAGKARRYREWADRLQELRTQVGLADWRKLTEKLEGLEAELKASHEENTLLTSQVDTLESRGLELDMQMIEADSAIRASESAMAQNRERIATHEATIEHERRRTHDLDEEVSARRRQLSAMSVRAGSLEQQLTGAVASLESIEAEHRKTAVTLAELERAWTKLTTQWDELRAQNEQRRAAHLEQLRIARALGNEISGLESSTDATRAINARGAQQLVELTAAGEQLEVDLGQLREQLEELTKKTDERREELLSTQANLAARRRQLSTAQRELAQLRQRHTGATERAAVLEELEKRLEGISAGVKELLVKARAGGEGPFQQIRGLVADLLHVNIETAPLVEVALGESAQHLVLADSREFIEHMQHQEGRLAGRVGLIRLDVLPPTTGLEQVDLTALPGVIGRADHFVETAPEFAVLARRLLGRTWVVETLADALELQDSAGRGFSFVTRACELLAADGTLVLGPRQTSLGLISRRSELRALRHQIVELATKITQGESQCVALETTVTAEDVRVAELANEHQQLHGALGEQRLKTGAAAERLAQIDKQRTAVETELRDATAAHEKAATLLGEAKTKLIASEATIGELEQRIAAGAAEAGQIDIARQRYARETSAAKVELAKREQQLENLRAQKNQLERDQQERGKALSDSRAQLTLAMDRSREAERSILRASSSIAELYLRKEGFAVETVAHINRREEHRAEKATISQEVQRLRGRIRKLETKLHVKELAAGEVRHERTTLAERMREDYGIDLASHEHQPSAEELTERDSVEAEIAELRSKINSIGGVNLDALGELDELEARFAALSSQYQDLASAKASLEQIIGKINADSRRLFAETLEVVRGHFQTLFRKLFGGGQADIILDEGVDILDSGIEIVARPPGKEPRNISLLSGGEKTLTCVALLLAIFRSRPSPFCVLDEVDAALDEANIERFIGVLKEFLAWTQFIVVTHSKKTMTCASTLYGVTMQESGISKRVSVRFEDVSENGEINSFQPEPENPADGETQAA